MDALYFSGSAKRLVMVLGNPSEWSRDFVGGLRGEKVDARADLFSAGLVLYVMIARRSFYDLMTATDDPATFKALPLSQLASTAVPRELGIARIVIKALLISEMIWQCLAVRWREVAHATRSRFQ
jgi:hypothetical protein